tara:strand:- start:6371 stop:6949 length:579 start_codon:yes stop_codon:yes gene_type:complete
MSVTYKNAPNETSKIICNKDNIILKRNEDFDTFSMSFEIKNKNINLTKIINLKLYTLLYELNKDVIEKVDILSETDKNSTVLLIFKQFGADLGISKKYMCLYTEIEAKENTITMRSKTANIEKNTLSGISRCEEITCPYTDLYVTMKSETEASINYVFNMQMEDELPIYMENMIGMLMKKILLRVKEFIERA